MVMVMVFKTYKLRSLPLNYTIHMHDLGGKYVLSWGKNEWFFSPFCPPFLAQGYRLCGTFCIKNPRNLKHEMRSEQLSAAISPNLTTRLLMYTTFPYDCEKPSHVAQKVSEWPFLVITGGKKWKAIKTSEGNDFLKVTQRHGTEWKLRSELIRSDISDIIINAIIVIIQYFSTGTHQMVCRLDIHHYLTCQS